MSIEHFIALLYVKRLAGAVAKYRSHVK